MSKVWGVAGITLLIFAFIGSIQPSAQNIEPTCVLEAIHAEEHRVSSNKLPEGEYIEVATPEDGEERVCRDTDDNEVSRATVTERKDGLILEGSGDLPDGYDGQYDEQEVVEDLKTHGELTRTYFGTYTPQYDTSYVSTPIQTGARTGAECNDGTYSSATGRGACSHHGGVAVWLYD